MTTQLEPRLAATLTVGDVAERAGVTANAVRFYERYGIVHSYRTSTNARRFTVDAVCRIKLARAAQRVGLTLREAADILADIPPRSGDLDLWAAAGRRLVVEGQARIRELQAAVDEFTTPEFLRS